MNARRLAWLILAVLAGFAFAMFAFRRAYGRRPQVAYSNVPPSARPRYIVYGDYYDPYATWPYGPSSSYGLVVSGAPVSSVPGGTGRSVSTGPGNSIYGGYGGGGIAAGTSLGGGFRGG